MLELDRVTKSFGSHTVLHPTTLTFAEGTTTVLIGPSGCGKSTLLRIMIGLIQPDSGSVRFQGEVFSATNQLEMRHRIGYVIQDGGLFPHLSAFDNVGLLARFLGRDIEWIRRRIDELTELVRLPREALSRFPAQLSGGQRQRLGIMRALMLDPPLVLLDEPMGALDPLVRFDLQNDLREIFRTLNKTVVLVTHDMGEAGFFGDEVLLLGGGKIVQRGTLKSLLDSPADDFVTRFIQAQRLPGHAS
ncbi:MAG: ATP-binding cassette domain-containing protein [Planctomycetaceae bacterium]